MKLTPETECTITAGPGYKAYTGTIKRFHPTTGVYVIELPDHSLTKATKTFVVDSGLTKTQVGKFLDRWWKVDPNSYAKEYQLQSQSSLDMVTALRTSNKSPFEHLLKYTLEGTWKT